MNGHVLNGNGVHVRARWGAWVVNRGRRATDTGWLTSFRGATVNIVTACLLMFLGWATHNLLPSPAQQQAQLRTLGDSLRSSEARIVAELRRQRDLDDSIHLRQGILMAAVVRHLCETQRVNPVVKNPEMTAVCRSEVDVEKLWGVR